jgi:1-deoxy-D-xylulose-5-phosphate reductoisomerase
VVLNAANEVAVASFLEGRLGFTAIPRIIAETMDAHVTAPTDTLEGVRRIDRWARDYATGLVQGAPRVAGKQ